MKWFQPLQNLGRHLLLFPAFLCLKASWFRSATFSFFILLFFVLGLTLTWGWPAFLFIFWLCLSLSFLNQKIHQEKQAIIEGHTPENKAIYLHYSLFFSRSLLVLIHFFLLSSLILILRQASLFWGESLFSSSSLTLVDWSIYAIDLILKAVLFDIPEIYNLNLTTINHHGFWGSTLVFFSRLVVLVLILGSLLRWREINQMVWQAIGMLEHSSSIAENRLLLITKMYPAQTKRLCKWCLQLSKQDFPYKALIEVLGKTKQEVVQQTLASLFKMNTPLEIKEATLRGMEFYGTGETELIKPVFENEKFQSLKAQACRTLGIWKTQSSIQLLNDIAAYEPVATIRLKAIESLGLAKAARAVPFLLKMMFQEEKSKEERFAAKEAICAIGVLTQNQRLQLYTILQQSEFSDNRRFAAMVLEKIYDLKDFTFLNQCLFKETDADTQVYLLKGIGAIAASAQNHSREAFQIVPEKYWEESFNSLKTMLSRTKKIFVQVATIQTITDFAWLTQEFILAEDDFTLLLKPYVDSTDTQLADVAADSLTILSQLFNAEHLASRRRDSITAIGMDDLNWRSALISSETEAVASPSVGSKIPTTIFPDTDDIPKDLFTKEMPQELQERYQIIRTIQTGKVSTIFQVLDLATEQEKVLKCTTSTTNPKHYYLIEREIEILRTCPHPNIIPLLEEYSTSEYLAFTMPWFNYQNLFEKEEQRKAEKKLWTLSEFKKIMRSLSEAISALHQAGWYHGDLKPENILYHEPELILLDFNSAHPIKTTSPEEIVNDFLGGTPYYMAPEQLNQQHCDLRVDIYALGIIGYELLTGALPLGLAPMPIHKIRLELPETVHQILTRATQFYPEERYASVQEFWEKIEQVNSSQ